MPRAFLVNHWLEASDTASSIEMMAAADFNPGETAVVIGLEDGGSQGASSGTVDFASYEPERVRLSTASESAGMLVLTDAHYPGWIATVDGQPAEIYQANGYFRGILVPPGNHTVEFHFEPSTLPTGLVLSSLGIFVVVVLLVIGFRKREVE
jgi:hypothetical protein